MLKLAPSSKGKDIFKVKPADKFADDFGIVCNVIPYGKKVVL